MEKQELEQRIIIEEHNLELTKKEKDEWLKLAQEEGKSVPKSIDDMYNRIISERESTIRVLKERLKANI